MKATVSVLAWLGFISPWLNTALAQDDVDVSQCALACISNVDNTTCAKAEFSCLCQDRMYIDRMNDCVYKACNKSQEDATFFQVAQLCNIFSYTLTYGPEATASIVTSDPILNTQGIPSESSLPPVVSTSTTQTAPDVIGTGTATEPASTSAPSSTAQASSGAPAAATSNAAMKGATSSHQGFPMLLLSTCIGWWMSK